MRMDTIKLGEQLYSPEFEAQLNGKTPIIVKADEFSDALEILLLANNPDSSSATTRASQNLQLLVYQLKITPLVENITDVQMWNSAMRTFVKYTRGLDVDEANVYIIDWWKETLTRHGQCIGDSLEQTLDEIVCYKEDDFTSGEDFKLADCYGDGAEQEWLKAFPCDALFAKGLYRQLLYLGQVQYLVEHGMAGYVIGNFKLLDHTYMELSQNEGNQAAYEALVKPVTEEMLQAYLDDDPQEFDFFVVHPLGLKILHCNEFSGAVARWEYRFIRNGKHFPDSFRISDRAEHDYIMLLNNQLDAGLPVPPLPEPEEEEPEELEMVGYEPFPQRF